jgi:Delta7-sterol 5-desaturase
MLQHLLGLPETPLNTFLVLTLGGLVLYFFFSGISYVLFFGPGKARFHPTYEPEPAVDRLAMKWSLIGTLGNVVLMMPLHLAMANGWSRVYWNVSDFGWGYLALSIVLYVAFTETWIYWAHRWLHTPWAYKKLHKVHHDFRVTNSWVSMAFHPLDSFLQAAPHHLFGFLLPVHGLVYLTFVSFVSVWSVMIHDRVSFVRSTVINTTNHHTLHHWYYNYNFGQFFTFWDRLMGTWKDPEVAARREKIPAEIMSWSSAPPQRDADAPAVHVRYKSYVGTLGPRAEKTTKPTDKSDEAADAAE